MDIRKLEYYMQKYDLDEIIERCTVDGEHCRAYFEMREDGQSEQYILEFHKNLVYHYPEKDLRLLFMKTFMGGFTLSTDEK